MTPVIRCEGLTKHYGPVVGLEDLHLEIQQGEIFGYLGPNGAGKTTTMRLWMGLLKPTSGRAEIFGLDVVEDSQAIRARVGYLPGDMRVYEQLSGGEYLNHLAGLRSHGDRGRREALARRFDLDLERPIGELSKGNRQKIGLVQAFMHEPDLLLLDEPTSGLDPLMQRTFHDLVRETKSKGATVVLSSHVMDEVERIVDRVGVIRHGELILLDEMKALKRRIPRQVALEFAAEPPPQLLAGVAGVEIMHAEGTTLRLRVAGPVGAVVRQVAAAGLVDMTITEPQLEDIFMSYYEGDGDLGA